MRVRTLVIACIGLLFSLPALCDPISPYTEPFTTNPSWTTDFGALTELFQSNYASNAAKHSTTGGNPGGYGYSDIDWPAFKYVLLFANADSTGQVQLGDYSNTPYLSVDIQRLSNNNPGVFVFFASEAGSTIGSSTSLYFYNTSTYAPHASTNTWTTLTADLTGGKGTEPNKWSAIRPDGDPTRGWSTAVGDVDLIGVLWFDSGESNNPQMRVDNFTVTPEPGLLMTMAPMAGFLGWRLRHSRRKRTVRA